MVVQPDDGTLTGRESSAATSGPVWCYAGQQKARTWRAYGGAMRIDWAAITVFVVTLAIGLALTEGKRRELDGQLEQSGQSDLCKSDP